MSTPETQGTPARPAAGGPQTLASDADRDTAAGLLNAALAEGRLTADLPAPPAAAIGRAAHGMFAGADLCLLCVLLVACPPAGIAWLLLSWRRSRTDPDRPLAGTGGPAVLGGR